MITLSREAVAVLDEPDSMQVWPLRITAVSDTEGVPDAIFVYHRNTMTDETGDSDIFECVASGPQLQELGLEPVLDDGDGNAIPFYRSDVCEFHCRSEVEAADLWARIQVDVAELSDNMAAALSLSLAEEVEI